MTTRTVKLFGLAYGSTPAEISVTLDGATVHSGAVTTENALVPTLPNTDLSNTTVELCNFEIPVDFDGSKPMTCTVNSGTVIFAQITANYYVFPDTSPLIGSGPDVFQSIAGNSDPRSNVFINGVAQTVNHDSLAGTWWFTIPSGSVMSYDLNIIGGTANVPPTETPAP
jgi:hypothetical protein